MWVCWDAPPGSCLRPAHHGPTGLLPIPMLATVGATASPGPVPRDGPAGPSDPSTPHRPNQKHLLRRLQFPTGRDRARHCDQCLIVTFQAQDDQTPTMCRPPARACLRPQRRENCAGMNTRHDMRIRGWRPIRHPQDGSRSLAVNPVFNIAVQAIPQCVRACPHPIRVLCLAMANFLCRLRIAAKAARAREPNVARELFVSRRFRSF
jgi:hypothetical protein